MSDVIILAIGIDIGGEIKFSCGNLRIVIPNVIGSAESKGWGEITADKSWINNLILIENDEEYYIGELARTQSEIKHYIVDQGNLRKIDDIFLIIKAVLPLISKQNEQDIILGIGAPVSTSIEKMKELSSRLKGEIDIKIKNDATNKDYTVKKNIVKAFVMPESYGTYYNVVSSFEDKTAFDAIVISLDILTEIIAIYNGTLMRKASRNLTNASLFVLSNKITVSLRQQTGTIIHPYSILQSIRNNSDFVVISGKTYDISKVKEHYIRQISAEIADNLVEVLKTLPLDTFIEYYIISGEAVDVFWTEIQMKIIEKNLIDDFNLERIIIVKDPSFSNATGFENMVKKKYHQDFKLK